MNTMCINDFICYCWAVYSVTCPETSANQEFKMAAILDFTIRFFSKPNQILKTPSITLCKNFMMICWAVYPVSCPQASGNQEFKMAAIFDFTIRFFSKPYQILKIPSTTLYEIFIMICLAV
jgi:hypothetical protein